MARKKIAPERKKEIVAGLYKCLANTGHEQVTIKDIAKAANLSYGSLHYYFDSKKSIMFAVVEEFAQSHEKLFEEHVRRVESAWEQIRLGLSFAVEHFVVDPEASAFFLNLYQMALSDQEMRNVAVGIFGRLRSIFREVIEYGISRGEFIDVDPEISAFLLTGCFEGMWIQVAMDPDLYGREEIENILFETARRHLNPKLEL